MSKLSDLLKPVKKKHVTEIINLSTIIHNSQN